MSKFEIKGYVRWMFDDGVVYVRLSEIASESFGEISPQQNVTFRVSQLENPRRGIISNFLFGGPLRPGDVIVGTVDTDEKRRSVYFAGDQGNPIEYKVPYSLVGNVRLEI